MIVEFPAEVRARARRKPEARESVESLLSSLRGRRDKLEGRLQMLSLAIDRLEDQVAVKRRLEILPGDPA
ncbi:MAG: hypothetical protein FJZ01_13265 [Candidatus Sericytochromatia bacterium]|nr:hypothetical protein [Candidatus Tanganyikabacteria bacterium]